MEKLVTPAELCQMIPGMTVSNLKQMRQRGDGPPFIKPSERRVVYRLSAVEKWLDSREQLSTRDAVAA